MTSSECPEFLHRNGSRAPNELEQDLDLHSPNCLCEIISTHRIMNF